MQTETNRTMKILFNIRSLNENNISKNILLKIFPQDLQYYLKGEDLILTAPDNATVRQSIDILKKDYPMLTINQDNHFPKYLEYKERGSWRFKDKKECRLILENCTLDFEEVKRMMTKIAGTTPECRAFHGKSKRFLGQTL